MEVFLKARRAKPSLASLLHVRGGVSTSQRITNTTYKSSPRPWRCFFSQAVSSSTRSVFSTSVEVFPLAMPLRSLKGGSSPRPWRCFFRQVLRRSLPCSLLHVRGGVSKCNWSHRLRILSSPRPWRCFQPHGTSGYSQAVFSTSVEVFPLRLMQKLFLNSLLHVRGGVSTVSGGAAAPSGSSPRPWRCFLGGSLGRLIQIVFSTSVEVFPYRRTYTGKTDCLLHVRGGVSTVSGGVAAPSGSSPRLWRCFCSLKVTPQPRQVFSTSVEVFLSDMVILRTAGKSSPRPWRCFPRGAGFPCTLRVFSTSMEVFP